MIRFVIGSVLKVEAVLLLLPFLISLLHHELKAGLWFLPAAAIAAIVGILFTIKKPKSTVFYLKEGCVCTAMSWIVMSVAGCLPFWLSGEIPSFTDALFETVSGFTTTGASILLEVEPLSKCMLFWRSFTHWVGGMGVLVFLLAVVPMSGGSNINLMRAESPGPSVGKLVPKIKSTARILYIIYFVLTFIEFVLLMIFGMTPFEAICSAMGTAGTGGFGVRNDSFVSYSPAIQWIVTIFMIMFGVNFNAYYMIIFHQVKKAFKMEEVRVYLSVIVTATIILLLDTVHVYGSVFEALTHSAFRSLRS